MAIDRFGPNITATLSRYHEALSSKKVSISVNFIEPEYLDAAAGLDADLPSIVEALLNILAAPTEAPPDDGWNDDATHTNAVE